MLPVSSPSAGGFGNACKPRMNSSNAVADFAFAVRKDVVEPENVSPEKLREMFRRLRQSVHLEKFADEADIRAPGELHFLGAVMQVEFRGEGFFESLRAGVARVDERAVNVE